METEVKHDQISRLTAAGESAIAVYQFGGELAVDLAQQHLTLRSGTTLHLLPLDKIHYGFWDHSDAGGLQEDVVVCRTEDSQFEIHFHGSPAVEKSLRSAAAKAGINFGSHGEDQTLACASSDNYLQRFLPAGDVDSSDWSQVDLKDENRWDWSGLLPYLPIDQKADSGLGIERFVKQQLAIALTNTVAPQPSEALMLQATGRLLAGLNEISRSCAVPSMAIEKIQQLRSTWSFGKYFQQPMTVLLTGKPNVGKSSLINALLGYSRSIVTEIAGTTRDLVTQNTIMAGWPFQLIDSAGIRTTVDRLESQGIERVERIFDQAEIVVQVLDASQNLRDSEMEGNDRMKRRPELIVWNKVDLATQAFEDRRSSEGEEVLTSTVDGHGIEELLEAITKKAAAKMQRPDDWADGPIVFSHELDQWLAGIEAKLLA